MTWLILDAASSNLVSNYKVPSTIADAQAGLANLLELAGQVQAFTVGSTDALIYAGSTALPGSDSSTVAAWQLAKTYSNANNSCMIIDNTDAAEFINSDEFRESAGSYLQKIDGIDPADTGAITQSVNNLIYGKAGSIVSSNYATYISQTPGIDIHSILLDTGPNSIARNTEFPIIAQGINPVDGIPADQIQNMVASQGQNAALIS